MTVDITYETLQNNWLLDRWDRQQFVDYYHSKGFIGVITQTGEIVNLTEVPGIQFLLYGDLI